MDLRSRLREAESAYHDLMAGRAVVEVVDENGVRIKYAQANRSSLANYIQELKNEMSSTRSGPMQVWGR